MIKGSWREFDNQLIGNQPNFKCKPTKVDQRVRVSLLKSGKAGKTVTAIIGIETNVIEAKGLLKRIKKICGTGGTLKNDVIEIQGEHIIAVIEFLKKEGYRPKKSGG
tara:strand:+ start:934 stop:1254 length:321 start_codon:yes stop_codon:yes gene_type:complete